MEQLAWLVLRAVNQTQTKGSAVRLAVPTAPEIDAQLASLPVAVTDEELLSAEEYLERHGYLARADITLARGTYTITRAEAVVAKGVQILATGMGERQRGRLPRPVAGEAQEGVLKPRRRRTFAR